MVQYVRNALHLTLTLPITRHIDCPFTLRKVFQDCGLHIFTRIPQRHRVCLIRINNHIDVQVGYQFNLSVDVLVGVLGCDSL